MEYIIGLAAYLLRLVGMTVRLFTRARQKRAVYATSVPVPAIQQAQKALAALESQIRPDPTTIEIKEAYQNLWKILSQFLIGHFALEPGQWSHEKLLEALRK